MGRYFAPTRIGIHPPRVSEGVVMRNFLLHSAALSPGVGRPMCRFRRSNFDTGKLQVRRSGAGPRFVWRLGSTPRRWRRRLYHFRSRREKDGHAARRHALSTLGARQTKFRTARKRASRDLREYDGPAHQVLRSHRSPADLPCSHAIPLCSDCRYCLHPLSIWADLAPYPDGPSASSGPRSHLVGRLSREI